MFLKMKNVYVLLEMLVSGVIRTFVINCWHHANTFLK